MQDVKLFDDSLMGKVRLEVEKRAEMAGQSTFLRSSDLKWEVTYMMERHVVHFKEEKCDCRRWQLDGIPCLHAITVMMELRKRPKDYCSKFLETEKYRESYKHVINAMSDEDMWVPNTPGEKVFPPEMKKKAGRPKTKRHDCI